MNITKDPDARQLWRAAWCEASHGRSGFWRHARPGDHFRTGPMTSGIVARLLGAFCEQHGIGAVIDIGAGDGTLLTSLANSNPTLDLYGVDLRPAPDTLAPTVAWATDTWQVSLTDSPDDARPNHSGWTSGEAEVLLATLDRPTLIVAHEWLDDLPTTVIIDGHDAAVDDDGSPIAGAPLSGADRDWLQRWWPAALENGQAEVGTTRDEAWSAVLSPLRSVGGFGLMIDYGHTTADRRATLTGFRAGQQVEPIPDGTMNLTAHVAVDAVAAAADRIGDRRVLARQHEVFDTGLFGVRPPPPPATDNPITALAERSTRTLTHHRQGDLWWLLHQVHRS
ncbi:SAM-dependent methyltransferase [Propionibacteriaceae bacterium Y1700]|uniref:SAM-dependent methyltransferase n=1 Tax=Microlunatus sp. Y1700 TaxID=3418487 RepID=UPI003DA70C04